jgi:hypothetical protein
MFSDAVDGEGAVVIEQVAAGVGPVGAACQTERADGQVTEAGQGSRCGPVPVLSWELFSHGDADQVALLSQMMEKVEEINNQFATFDGTGSKH